MVRKHLKILCPVKTCFSKFKLQNRKPFLKGGTLVGKRNSYLFLLGFTAASLKRSKKRYEENENTHFLSVCRCASLFDQSAALDGAQNIFCMNCLEADHVGHLCTVWKSVNISTFNTLIWL